MAKMVASAHTGSCLSYMAQLKNLYKLQRAQNLLARVVTGSFQSSSHNLLQWLHWLPIEYCINFKIANITVHNLHSSQSAYLHSALHTRHSTRSLRLSNTNTNLILLSIPYVRTSFDACSFSVAASTI